MDYFNGIDTSIFRDMTKMGVAHLTEIRLKFEGHEDLLHVLDEQVELLINNVALAQQQDNLRLMVRRGEMSDLVAAMIFGNISRKAKENHDEIVLNGRIIGLMMASKSTGTEVSA